MLYQFQALKTERFMETNVTQITYENKFRGILTRVKKRTKKGQKERVIYNVPSICWNL